MTPASYAAGQRVLNAVRSVTDIPACLVLGDGRSMDVCAARFAVILILRRKFGWSLCRIGRRLGRDHSTILAAIQQADGLRPMLLRCRLALDIAAKAELVLDEDVSAAAVRKRSANDNYPSPVPRVSPERRGDIKLLTSHGYVTRRGEIILRP